MSNPPATGPDFSAPSQPVCYRHPDRPTGISCQRCRRPVCGECMNPASVGFQCPSCVSSGRANVRAPRTQFGALLTSGSSRATTVLMGVLIGVYVLNLVSQNRLVSLLALVNYAVSEGQFWRLLTSGFTSVGLLGALMNLLVLWIAGRALEHLLGTWRFVALFVLAGLGGATVAFVLGPDTLVGFGASSALVGLLAANAIVKRRGGEDIRPDIGLLVLITLYSVLIGFRTFGWLGLIGGITVGALSGWILAYAPQRHRQLIQVTGLASIAILCALGVFAKLTLT